MLPFLSTSNVASRLSASLSYSIYLIILIWLYSVFVVFFFFQAEDGIRDDLVTGVQTCALPISSTERRNKQCVVHTAETDEQKCSRRCTAATVRIATGNVFTAGLASVPKRDQYVGAAWIGSGRGALHCGKDGAVCGRQLCVGSVRLRHAEWISKRQELGGMWITSYRQGSSGD